MPKVANTPAPAAGRAVPPAAQLKASGKPPLPPPPPQVRSARPAAGGVLQPRALIRSLGATWDLSGYVKTSKLGGDWHASVNAAAGAAPDNIFYDGFHVTYEGDPADGRNPHFFFTGAKPNLVYEDGRSKNHPQSRYWRGKKTAREWNDKVIEAKAKAATANMAPELAPADVATVRAAEVKRIADAAAAAAAKAAADAVVAAAAAAGGNSLEAWLHANGKPVTSAAYHRGVGRWRGTATELADYQAWCAANNRAVVP